jgi:putative salt-induced outer membrane protein YdiY
MKKIAKTTILSISLLFWLAITGAAELPTMDSRYIKEHFPEVYRQIYEEGRAAGKTEGAAASAAPAAPVALVVTQTKPALGAWWEKNSLKYSPLPEQWLFHIEGTLDYKHKSGNTQSDLYDGSASFMARKSRFTNTLTYLINKEFTKQSGQPGAPVSKTDDDYRSFQESIRYDLTDRLYSEGGYIWEKDTANYISDRDSYYAGLGYTLIDTEHHLLDVLVAGGYEEESYPGAVKEAMNFDRNCMTVGYLKEYYQWHITDRITFKETFRIIQDFSDTRVFNDDMENLRVTGETNRYRWFFRNEIYFKLIDHLNFMTGCQIEYDSNPWPTVKKRDTTIKSGIQFSF